ncbi:MAG TPA: hypothetical protein VF665_08645 [Longimicrobium sp.]|jgi:hypothetical protein|uniref:hypothetical protein n=1 Tax=Longimicrobium sp. TaxID=2029185 RepID=UPI002EDAD78D
MKRMWTTLVAALVLAGSVAVTPAHAATAANNAVKVMAAMRYSIIDVILISDEVCGPDAVGWSASNFTDDGWDLTCYY